MSNIEITLEGGGIIDTFHNDWDQCEARSLLHIEDLEGWYGGVGASVTPDLSRFRRHGKFPGRTIRSARKMDLTLTWHESIDRGEASAYTLAARIASGIAWDEGPYTMTVNEDGFILSTEVQLDGEPSLQPIEAGSEQAFRIRIPLRASDPFLYGPADRVNIRRYSHTPVVLPDPFTHGYTDAQGRQVLAWSATGASPAPLTNNGTADAYPVVEIVGDDPTGASLVMNGETVQYRGPLFAQSPLTIDYKRGSASMNGRDVSQNLRMRGWSAIKPHTSTSMHLVFLGEGTGYGTATVRPTYI